MSGVRKKIPKYHVTTLMNKMGLNCEEEPVAKIAARDANFLYSDDSKFDLSVFRNSPYEIICPMNQSGMLNLLRYLKNVHLALDNLRVTEETVVCIDNLKRSLIILLIYGNDLIGERIYLEDYSGNEVDESNPHLVSEFDAFAMVDAEIFLVILRCCVFLQHYYNFSNLTCFDDFQYAIDNLLINGELDHVPIFDYTIKDVLDCFNIIAWDWHKLRYSEDLVLFLDVMMTKFALTVYLPTERSMIPDAMFNEYCVLISMPGKDKGRYYVPSMEVVRDIGWMYQSMWKKAELSAQIYSHTGPNDLTRIPIFTKEQKELLKSRIYPCDPDGECKDRFRNFVLQSLIRPGERQHYLSTKPNESRRVDLVIRTRPGDEKLADKWMEQLSLDVAQIAQDTSCFDECVRDWAIMELFQFYVRTEACVETHQSYFWNYFDLIKLEESLAAQLNRPYPMLLQNFNWYGVYYLNRFYEHEDACSAALHWLYIVWENTCEETSTKFFPPTSTNNLQFKAYRFETCKFRDI